MPPYTAGVAEPAPGWSPDEEKTLWAEVKKRERGGQAIPHATWDKIFNTHRLTWHARRSERALSPKYERLRVHHTEILKLLANPLFTWDHNTSQAIGFQQAWDSLKVSPADKPLLKWRHKTATWLREEDVKPALLQDYIGLQAARLLPAGQPRQPDLMQNAPIIAPPARIQLQPPAPMTPAGNQARPHATPFSQRSPPPSNNPFRSNFVRQPVFVPSGIQRPRSFPSPPPASVVQAAPAESAPAPVPAAAPFQHSVAVLSLQESQANQEKHERVLDLLQTERKWLHIPGEIRAEELLRKDVMLRGTYLRYADDEDRRKAWLKSQLSATAYGSTAELYDDKA